MPAFDPATLAPNYTPTPAPASSSGAFDPATLAPGYTAPSADSSQPAPEGLAGYLDPKGYVDDAMKLGNIGINTSNAVKGAFNTSDTSEQAFADKEGQANDKVPFAGSPTAVQPEDLRTGKDLLKGLANVPVGTSNMIGNVGSFLWNANTHPIDTLSTVASDPVGFVLGLVPDSFKEVASGYLSAGKDIVTGQGMSKAGSDLMTAHNKAFIAFLDNPVQEMLKYSIVGDLLEAPAQVGAKMASETFKPYTAAADLVKGAAKNTSELGAAEGLAKTGQDALSGVSQTLTDIGSKTKTGLQMFTQEGRKMILAQQATDQFRLTKSEMDIKDYESQLQAADRNSDTAKQLQIKLDQAKLDNQTATKNLAGMQYTIANALNKSMMQKYLTVDSARADLSSNIEGSALNKDLSYQSALNRPDGTPIKLNDISDFTNSLRQRAETIGENQTGNAPTKINNFADGLELRQNISSAGGIKAYIDAETAKRIAEIKAPAAQELARQSGQISDQVQAEVTAKMKASGLDPKSFEKPITAKNLQFLWHSFQNSIMDDGVTPMAHFLNAEDSAGKPADSAYQDVMKNNLNRDNPNGYKYFQQGEDQYKNLKQLDVFKDKFGNVKNFDGVSDMIKTMKGNWDAVKQLDPTTQLKIQQTIASDILNQAIDHRTGTVNINTLETKLDANKDYLTMVPQVVQAMKEGTLDLGKIASTDPKLQSQIQELYGKTPEQITADNAAIPAKEGEIAKTADELKQAQVAQKIVGTDPQEIIKNIKGLKSVKDYENFMDKSGLLAGTYEKTAIKMGQIIKQDAFERNNPVDASGERTPTISGMLKTYQELQSTFKDASPQIREKFFPKEEQAKIDTGLKAYSELENFEKSTTKIPTKLGRVLYGAALGITTYLGWHFQAIRYGAKLLGGGGTEIPNEPLTAADFQKVIDDKATAPKTKTMLQNLKESYLGAASGYQSVQKNQQ